MSCGDKLKQRCPKVYANCTSYESGVNEASSLKDDSCLTIEETTQDIYNQLDAQNEGLDLSALGEGCLDYTKTDGKYLVKDVLKKFEEKLCEAEEASSTSSLAETSISSWGLDLECLQDSCGTQNINTLKDLLQAIITKIC